MRIARRCTNFINSERSEWSEGEILRILLGAEQILLIWNGRNDLIAKCYAYC